MLNGPPSTYVWIVCCTKEVYKYQALIEAIGRNVEKMAIFQHIHYHVPLETGCYAGL